MTVKDLKARARAALVALQAEEALNIKRKKNMREWWDWTKRAMDDIQNYPMDAKLLSCYKAMAHFHDEYELYLTAKKQGRGAAMSLLLQR